MERNAIDVVISSGYPETDTYLLRLISEQLGVYRAIGASGDAEFRERFPQARVILAWGVPAQAFALAKQLQWLQVIGTGVDGIVPAKDFLRGVTVTNVRGVFSRPIAEYVLAYALAHFQRIRQVLKEQQRHAWTPFVPTRFESQTFGIVGLGAIGTEIARRAGALGANVIGMRRSTAPAPNVERVYPFEEMADFFARCDVLVLALPGTTETRGFMSMERIAMLKPTCFVINVGRGAALPTERLLAALDGGLIGGAAIDVFEEEPLPPTSPLWDRGDVFITPHVSGVNRPEDVAGPILENLRRFASGRSLRGVVDLERGY